MADQVTMRERTEPKFVQFSPGELVEGVLISIKPISVQQEGGKAQTKALKYTVDDHGTLYAFLGTYQINEKLRPSDLGHAVSVRYEGESATVTRNGKGMREFTVAVSDEKVSEAALFITDSDIPF
jgi:hypothetical protein